MVTVSMQGYRESTVSITKEGIEGWFWGNILCGGIIGIIVDLTNGAMHKLGPEYIFVDLIVAHIPGKDDTVYAAFQALDSQGQLRSLSVPLVKKIPIADSN